MRVPVGPQRSPVGGGNRSQKTSILIVGENDQNWLSKAGLGGIWTHDFANPFGLFRDNWNTLDADSFFLKSL